MDFPLLVAAVLVTAAVTVALAHATGKYAWCAVAGSPVILLLHSRIYFDYQSDDAYISFRYARNLADGLGPVWNRGDHVEGYSNFLWVALLAATRKLGMDTPFTARWLGFALSVVAAAGAYHLARRLLPGAPGRMAGVFATIALASSGTWAAWAMAGLEGPLFSALILAAALLHLRERERGGMPASGAVWAFVAMTRPDGVLFFGVSAAFRLADALSGPGRRATVDAPTVAAPRPTLSGEFLRLAAWGAGFALLFVPYFAWRYGYYGWLLPNTYYAKVGSNLTQYDRGLRYFALFSRTYAAPLLLLVPVAVAFNAIKRGPALYLGALIGAWAAYVIFVGGDGLIQLRLFQPILPIFYVLICCSAAALFNIVRLEPMPRRAARAAASALVGVGFIALTLQPSVDGLGLFGGSERAALRDRTEIGLWLHDQMPDTTVIAIMPAGTLPYVAQLPSIDMLGLNDEHIAHRDMAIGIGTAGHEKFDTDYVLDRKPEIIILFDTTTAFPLGRRAYVSLGSLIPAFLDMARSPRLLKEYDARSVELSKDRWFSLLVRRDAAAVLSKTVAAPQ